MAEKFQEHFGNMTDPRVERTKLYPLEEILFVLLCGSVCGAESWHDFVMFGQEKLNFCVSITPFPPGFPGKTPLPASRLRCKGWRERSALMRPAQPLTSTWSRTRAWCWRSEKFNEIKAVPSRAGPARCHRYAQHRKKHFKGIGVKGLHKKTGWGNDNLRLILKQNF